MLEPGLCALLTPLGTQITQRQKCCADLSLAMQRMCFFILKAPVNSLICTLAMHLQAMRLFVGEPVWTPLNRPIDDHESRKKYVETFNASKAFEMPGSISSASPIAAH